MSDVKIVVSAQDQASRVLDTVRGSMERVRGATDLVAAGLGLVGIAGVAGLGQIVKASIDSTDALNDVADATGSTVEKISALEDIGDRTGNSLDVVQASLLKLNSVLNDATPGSKQETILKSIGLSAAELRKLDPADAVLEVSKALNNYADNGDRARLMEALLGKSTKELSAFMKDLAEQGKLVATVTTDQAEQADKFNKQLFELQKNAKDAGRSLTTDLVTGINKAAQAWRESGLIEGFRTLLTGDDQYKNDVALVEQTEKLLRAEKELATSRAADAKYGDKSLRTAAAERQLKIIKEQLDLTMQYRKVLAGTDAPEAPKPSAPAVPDSGAAAASKSVADKARKEQEREAKELQEIRLRMKRQEVIDADAARMAANEAELKHYAAAEAAWQQFADQRVAALAKELGAMQDSNATLAQQVQEIGLTTDQLGALKLARMDETIAQEQATLATAAANGMSYEEISALEQKIELLKKQRDLSAQGQVAQAAADSKKDADAASKDYANTLQNDLKGAFSAAFRDTNGKPLQAFGDALANVIYSRAATALADSLVGSVLGSAGGSGGSAGGFSSMLSLFTSFDGGGYTGSGARSGGLDGKGGFLSIMHPQETVTDHTKGQRSSQQAQPLTVIQNFTVGDVATVSMVRQAVSGSERRIASAMGRSMSYGGALG